MENYQEEEGTVDRSDSFPGMVAQKVFSSPLLLLIILVIMVFWAEVAVMIAVSFLPPLTIITGAFIDALLLTLITVPLFYLLLLRPVQLHIQKRRIVEKELRNHRMHLEEKVRERTNDLIKSNEQLKSEVEKRAEAEEALKTRMKELEDFYSMSVGRELRMKELQEEMERLKSELSRLRKENRR